MMTIAQEEASRKHAEEYSKSIDKGIRKSKRLQSLTCRPNINTSRLRRLHELFWVEDKDDLDLDPTRIDSIIDESDINTDIGTFKTCNNSKENGIGNGMKDGSDIDLVPVTVPETVPVLDRPFKISSRMSMQKIHSSPNIYTIDNFLSHSELQYFQKKIKIANENKMFKRSFTDEENEIKRGKRRRTCRVDDHSECTISGTLEQDLNINLAEHEHVHEDDVETTTPTPSKQRTSKFIHFTKQSDSTITSIEQRACEMLSIPNDNIEPLQLVKYQTGQYFKVHHDLGILYDDGSVELPQRLNTFLSPPRRIVTILVYLNDVKKDNGGSTKFPLLKQTMTMQYQHHHCHEHNQKDLENECLEIYPKKGMAVVWCNITKDGLPDTRVVHSGEELVSTPSIGAGGTCNVIHDKEIVKYALNIWACEY